MNPRNVEALVDLLNDDELVEKQEIFQDWKEVETVAKFLASRGVLVPSALTESQAWGIGDKGHDYGSDAHMTEIAVETVAALERIAKGED